MESLETISKLEIPTTNISYNKKSKLLSIDILGFVFAGHYKKSTKLIEILDDIYSSLEKVQFDRINLCFIDVYNNAVPENKKLKDLDFEEKTEIEEPTEIKEETIKDVKKKEEKQDYGKRRRDEAKKSKPKKRLVIAEEKMMEDEEDELEELLSGDISYEKESEAKKSEIVAPASRGLLPPSPGGIGGEPEPEPGAAPADLDEGEMLGDDISYFKESEEEKSEIAAPASRSRRSSGGKVGGLEPEDGFAPADLDMAPKAPAPPPAPAPALSQPILEPEEAKPTTYNINMGFQYYSVMMEQKSYLFYVYLSHKELKILDEEGKTVYKTTFTVTTYKKEPPVLDLRIEGEGFEIHPLTGKIVVKKDAVNPPVMIFSILPLKQMKKKKDRKKKSERRYLNVYIDFEEKTISHTVLSVIVQPKHFHLDIGPIQLDISKKTAFLISFISVLVATISTIFSALTLETTSLTDVLSGFAPGLASFIFLAVFIITLVKNGIYPLKQKWSALLNFDKGIGMMK